MNLSQPCSTAALRPIGEGMMLYPDLDKALRADGQIVVGTKEGGEVLVFDDEAMIQQLVHQASWAWALLADSRVLGFEAAAESHDLTIVRGGKDG